MTTKFEITCGNPNCNAFKKIFNSFEVDFKDESYEEAFLEGYGHGGQDDDRRELETRYDELYTAKHDRSPGDVSDMSYDDLMSEIKELEEDLGVTERIDKVSPEDDQDPYYDLEDRLGRGGIVGMGRGAGLDETYIDNMPSGKVSENVINTIRAMVRKVLLEKAKTYKGKSMRLGGGGRFAKLVDDLKKKGKSEKQAKALAAVIGHKKYGKEKIKKMATAGKKRAAKKKD